MNKYYKKFVRIMLFTVAVLACIFLSVSCDRLQSMTEDQSYRKADDYVEVTGLRIDQAQIVLSPTGEPSTYALDVKILPENASNKKLSYYIAPEYVRYVTVDEDGLLSAKTVTPDDMIVPVVVTSTTNASATLTVSVTVQEASVSSIAFSASRLNLKYNGEKGKVTIVYTPSYAVDGRSITFTSLDEKIAKVSSDGTVTPLNAGQTHIKAVSETMDGMKHIAFIEVVVEYIEAQYRLEVSGEPHWTQVIGNFSPINFTLLVLGENTDPSPKIDWYVGTERVLGKTDQRQYSHLPTATTRLTYTIHVTVKSYGMDAITLYSQPITIYNRFSGIELSYDNFSQVYESYQYGETVTFALSDAASSSTVRYDWYIEEMDGDGTQMKVASTSITDRNLTTRLNVTGDYRIIAEAKDANGEPITKIPFTFSAERLSVGDTLVVHPSLNEGGLPPDSYHWYIVRCDEYGDYNEADKITVSSTPGDSTFYYPLNSAGYFRLLVTCSSNGVLATLEGEEEGYVYEGQVLRVYPMGELTQTGKVSVAVTDLAVDTMTVGDSEKLRLTWKSTSDAPYYKFYFYFPNVGTSYETDSNDAAITVNAEERYALIPQSVVMATDCFAVRIKQDCDEYSAYCYHNIDETVDFEQGIAYRYAVNAEKTVEGVVIEGVTVGDESLVNIHWDSCAGVNRYELEITVPERDEVILLDSADSQATFGDNYVYIPSDILSLQEKFYVRVKKKNSGYSQKYYYGIYNTEGGTDATHYEQVSEEHYSYLVNVTENCNLYIKTVDELYVLTEYLMLYRPTQNSNVARSNKQIGTELYDTFTVDMFCDVEYNTEIMNAFSVSVPETIDTEFIDLYTMVAGVRQQGTARIPWDVSFVSLSDGGVRMTLYIPNKYSSALSATQAVATARGDSAFYSDEPYGTLADSGFAIASREGVTVNTSDQIVFAMERGFRPVPFNNENLIKLYKTVKNVYASVVDAEMNDTQKALAFYDWIANNVSLDTEGQSLSYSVKDGKTVLTEESGYLYNCHHLEGVFFDNKALSDGMAKAFTVLCGLAGIPCYTVNGTVNGLPHAVNKIRLNNVWYNVDVSSARKTESGRVYVDHAYFLMTDTEYSLLKKDEGRVFLYGVIDKCETKYDFYENTVLNGEKLYVRSDEQLEKLLKSVGNGKEPLQIKFYASYATTEKSAREKLSEAASNARVTVTFVTVLSTDGEVEIVLFAETDK